MAKRQHPFTATIKRVAQATERLGLDCEMQRHQVRLVANWTIAVAVGATSKAVETRIYRAKEKLRTQLAGWIDVARV